MTSDFIKYSNGHNVRKLDYERAEPSGFAPRFLNVQLGFDQNLSKFGNIGLIGKPRDSATKIT